MLTRFAVLLCGVAVLAVGMALLIDGRQIQGSVGVVFFVTGLLVTLERFKSDVVRETVAELRRDRASA
jgi:hypothetical protein